MADPEEILDEPLAKLAIQATSHDKWRWSILVSTLFFYILLGIIFQWELKQLLPINLGPNNVQEDQFSVVGTTSFLVIIYGWSTEYYVKDLNWVPAILLLAISMGIVFSLGILYPIPILLYLEDIAPVFVTTFCWIIPACLLFEGYIWLLKRKKQPKKH
ncbi:MAG: hypothetical protein GY810_15070 [Aureispira sp.]|nr:hypothetical protein [Aureispira sp.]